MGISTRYSTSMILCRSLAGIWYRCHADSITASYVDMEAYLLSVWHQYGPLNQDLNSWLMVKILSCNCSYPSSGCTSCSSLAYSFCIICFFLVDDCEKFCALQICALHYSMFTLVKYMNTYSTLNLLHQISLGHFIRFSQMNDNKCCRCTAFLFLIMASVCKGKLQEVHAKINMHFYNLHKWLFFPFSRLIKNSFIWSNHLKHLIIANFTLLLNAECTWSE